MKLFWIYFCTWCKNLVYFFACICSVFSIPLTEEIIFFQFFKIVQHLAYLFSKLIFHRHYTAMYSIYVKLDFIRENSFNIFNKKIQAWSLFWKEKNIYINNSLNYVNIYFFLFNCRIMDSHSPEDSLKQKRKLKLFFTNIMQFLRSQVKYIHQATIRTSPLELACQWACFLVFQFPLVRLGNQLLILCSSSVCEGKGTIKKNNIPRI